MYKSDINLNEFVIELSHDSDLILRVTYDNGEIEFEKGINLREDYLGPNAESYKDYDNLHNMIEYTYNLDPSFEFYVRKRMRQDIDHKKDMFLYNNENNDILHRNLILGPIGIAIVLEPTNKVEELLDDVEFIPELEHKLPIDVACYINGELIEAFDIEITNKVYKIV